MEHQQGVHHSEELESFSLGNFLAQVLIYRVLCIELQQGLGKFSFELGGFCVRHKDTLHSILDLIILEQVYLLQAAVSYLVLFPLFLDQL